MAVAECYANVIRFYTFLTIEKYHLRLCSRCLGRAARNAGGTGMAAGKDIAGIRRTPAVQ